MSRYFKTVGLLFCQYQWRSSCSCWRIDGHLSCPDVGEGNTHTLTHTPMFEGVLDSPDLSPARLSRFREGSPAAFWLVLVPLCRRQALDLLLDKLKRAGLNFSRVRALSGGGQVGGASPTCCNTFVTKVTAQKKRIDGGSVWVLLGTPCSGDLSDWLQHPHQTLLENSLKSTFIDVTLTLTWSLHLLMSCLSGLQFFSTFQNTFIPIEAP